MIDTAIVALLALAAFFLGACQAVLEMTQAYAKDRTQFDKPIGVVSSLF